MGDVFRNVLHLNVDQHERHVTFVEIKPVMKIKISEHRFKQIVNEELAIAKLTKRMHEDTSTFATQQTTKPIAQQTGGTQVRRKKQYTCKCGAKFMDYDGIKGTPLCPKCNDAEIAQDGTGGQK